jgi:DedD protein
VRLVTEAPHDGEDAFHEIQLSGKQLVFLFMATTVVSVVIFLCGVLVGRGVRAEALNTGNGAMASSAGPGTPSPAPAPSVDPPAAPVEAPLSYPQRLQSDKAPAEELKSRSADAKKPADASNQASPVVAPPTPTPTPAPTPAPVTPVPAPAAAPASARPGTWAVQVVALTDRAAATAVMQRLTAKGYPAFLVNPQPGTPVQNYKVQVGRFSDKAEAEQVKGRLKKEEQFEPWILR